MLHILYPLVLLNAILTKQHLNSINAPFSPFLFFPSLFLSLPFLSFPFLPLHFLFSPSLFYASLSLPSLFSPSLFYASLSLPSLFSPSLFYASLSLPSLSFLSFHPLKGSVVFVIERVEGLPENDSIWLQLPDGYMRERVVLFSVQGPPSALPFNPSIHLSSKQVLITQFIFIFICRFFEMIYSTCFHCFNKYKCAFPVTYYIY